MEYFLWVVQNSTLTAFALLGIALAAMFLSPAWLVVTLPTLFIIVTVVFAIFKNFQKHKPQEDTLAD